MAAYRPATTPVFLAAGKALGDPALSMHGPTACAALFGWLTSGKTSKADAFA
ncbi:MAG: hypothetical protein ACREOH_17225 [Candidatus Entotheonellia bacterium]